MRPCVHNTRSGGFRRDVEFFEVPRDRWVKRERLVSCRRMNPQSHSTHPTSTTDDAPVPDCANPLHSRTPLSSTRIHSSTLYLCTKSTDMYHGMVGMAPDGRPQTRQEDLAIVLPSSSAVVRRGERCVYKHTLPYLTMASQRLTGNAAVRDSCSWPGRSPVWIRAAANVIAYWFGVVLFDARPPGVYGPSRRDAGPQNIQFFSIPPPPPPPPSLLLTTSILPYSNSRSLYSNIHRRYHQNPSIQHP